MESAPNIWYILKDIYEESIVAIISLKKAHLAPCSKSHPQRRCFPTNRTSPLICYSSTFRPATAPLLNGSHFFSDEFAEKVSLLFWILNSISKILFLTWKKPLEHQNRTLWLVYLQRILTVLNEDEGGDAVWEELRRFFSKFIRKRWEPLRRYSESLCLRLRNVGGAHFSMRIFKISRSNCASYIHVDCILNSKVLCYILTFQTKLFGRRVGKFLISKFISLWAVLLSLQWFRTHWLTVLCPNLNQQKTLISRLSREQKCYPWFLACYFTYLVFFLYSWKDSRWILMRAKI